jgi:hypothetical protein
MYKSTIRIIESLEAELAAAKGDEREELEYMLDAITSALELHRCAYCGKHRELEHSDDHDASLCEDCIDETPERLVGDEVQYFVHGFWK